MSIREFVENMGSDNLEVVGGKFEGGYRLQQIVDEIVPCVEYLVSLNRKWRNFLEIGSAAGGSAYLFQHYLKFENMVLIDNNQYLNKIKQPDLRTKNLKGLSYIEIIGNSRSPAVCGKFLKLNMTFDFMIIDGDHRLAQVNRDVEIYSPFLENGGYLMVHDIVACPGVKAIFMQMCNNKEYSLIKEYISTEHPRPCGIGLFKKKEDRGSGCEMMW